MAITFKEKMLPYAIGRRINAEEWNGVSRTAEEDSLAFGVPVMRGTDPAREVKLAAATNVVLGITETHQVLGHPGDNYEKYDTVAVMTAGVIGVEVGVTVAAGAQAWFAVAGAHKGKWVAAASTTDHIKVPGAFFDAAGGSGDVVPLRFQADPATAATTS